MRNVTLLKISSNTSQEVRISRGADIADTPMKGSIVTGPTVGECFRVFNGLKMSFRTSPIKNVEYKNENTLILTTINSVYQLTLGESFND